MPARFSIVMATLWAFWLAMALVAATTFALAARDGADGDATSSPTTTAAASPAAPTATPEATATPFTTPASRVPATAAQMTQRTQFGAIAPAPLAAPANLFVLWCDDGLLTVTTTAAVVYAEVDCNLYLLTDNQLRPLLGKPVLVTFTPGLPGLLTVESQSATVRFETARAWLQ